MDGFQHIWALIPGADDAAKLRFVIAGAAGAGAVWGLVRWLRKEDLGTTTKTILRTQASAEERAVQERHELRELVLQLATRVEAQLAASTGEAGVELFGGSSGIMQDLAEAVNRLAGEGNDEALGKLAAGDGTPAMRALGRMRAMSLRSRTGAEKEEAALARQQGAIALLSDADEAMRHYASACVLDPDNAEGWSRLGALNLSTGDAEGAERCYGRAMALGNSAESQEAMGIAMGHLGLLANRRGDRAAACAMWRQAIDLFRQVGMQPQIEAVEGWMREAGCAE
jgi:tetratricopeptide (TPR) repeat protein